MFYSRQFSNANVFNVHILEHILYISYITQPEMTIHLNPTHLYQNIKPTLSLMKIFVSKIRVKTHGDKNLGF